MRESKTYTNEEILSNLSKLGGLMDTVKLKRKGLNTEAARLRKQIEYWEKLDKSQLKLC